MENFDDSYFAREKKKAKKTEGEVFESEKGVHFYSHFESCFHFINNLAMHYLEGMCISVCIVQATKDLPSRRMTKRHWMLS